MMCPVSALSGSPSVAPNLTHIPPSSIVPYHGEAVSRQKIITVNMITIIMMVIASAYAASSSLKPCLFSDPSSQESFWSNGPFNLSFSVSSLSLSLSISVPSFSLSEMEHTTH